jgi:nucleoside-diphosphate-sugar epimerase
MTSVAILGCGYVGIELGRQLQTRDDITQVVGVRRSEEGIEAMREAGIDPVQGDLTEKETLNALGQVDVVVFAASAGGRDPESAREIYVEGQRTVLDYLGDSDESPDRYIYTSSTGVYGDHDGEWVDEDTPLEPANERTQLLAEAETVAFELGETYDIDTTVARFAGLYGPDRYRLQRYLDGPVTEGVLNLLHRVDAAGALEFLISTGKGRKEVVLVVDDEPVSKWDLADWLAEQCDRPSPPKQTVAERLEDKSLSTGARQRIESSKRCRNDKLQTLGYKFEHPTFRNGYREAIESYQSE